MTSFTNGSFVALLAGVLGLCSCAQEKAAYSQTPRPNGVVRSPSGKLRLIHDAGDDSKPALYGLYATEGELLGTTPSIINARDIKVPGLPFKHTVSWSPSEKTVLIHEDMSDASPEYRYLLMTRNSSGSYNSRAIDLGLRPLIPGDQSIYGERPSIESIDDSRVKLRWDSEPKVQYAPIPSP